MWRLVGMVVLAVVVSACSGGTDPSGPTTVPGAVAPASTTVPGPPAESTSPPTSDGIPATSATTAPSPLSGLDWEEVVAVDGFVTGLEPVGDDLLLTTKDGRVLLWSGGTPQVVGDFSGVVVTEANEQGLLDLALHPDGSRLFLHHTGRNGDTVLVEVPYPIESTESTELFRAEQPAGNHNGGSLEFGPDGMLYLALGDGGGAGDRFGQGQRTDTPLAAIHRFDVAVEGVAAPAAGNPFPDGPVPSLWAYGLRNPWRIAFTPPGFAGEPLLVVADVGQNAWEEVTFLPADAAGANLGWPVQEGRHCFSTSPCEDAAIRMAQVEVGHGDGGTCSITGGEVYLGDAIPELRNHYVFTDYCGGYLRSVDLSDGVPDPAPVVEWEVGRLSGPAVVAIGPDGELLASGQDGLVRRLVPIRNG